MNKTKSAWFCTLLFTICLIVNPAFAAVESTSSVSGSEPASVDGFRSAKFGMTESEINRSISKDFNISSSSVEKSENALEKTTSIAVTVPKLMEEGGVARVVYILGYKSKKLIQVNVIWGKPVNPAPNPGDIVSAANLLRNYFARKGFRKDNLVLNAKLNDGSVLVFRGTDSSGRMVVLLLNNPQNQKKDEKTDSSKDEEKTELSLRLSYIQDPNNPDVMKIEEGSF
jgi:hypothetical protein